jgi:oligoribonuclease
METKPIADPTAPLIWIDVETSGLASGSRILEIAVQVTDAQLQPITPLSSLLHCTIWMQDWDVEQMEPVARQMHERSGLLATCRADRCNFVHESNAESWILQCLNDHGIEPGRAPLAGSSVQFDRRVLAERMPALAAFLHYRSVDVSTLIELAARWRPDLIPQIVGLRRGTHRALPDLEDSINVLRLLRAELFMPAPGTAASLARHRDDVERESPSASAFEQHLEAASREVASWPEHKRNVLGPRRG